MFFFSPLHKVHIYCNEIKQLQTVITLTRLDKKVENETLRASVDNKVVCVMV